MMETEDKIKAFEKWMLWAGFSLETVPLDFVKDHNGSYVNITVSLMFKAYAAGIKAGNAET